MMNRFTIWAAIASLMARPSAFLAITLAAALTGSSRAATVNFVPNFGAGYTDLFYQPTAGSEFTHYELNISVTIGSLRDPDRGLPSKAGEFDLVADGARRDTWANTPNSSLGLTTPGYVFDVYHPGAPPFTLSDPEPSAGGTPDELQWAVFDVSTGDGPQAGPYHLARILVRPHSQFVTSIRVFDTVTAQTGGEEFNFAVSLADPEFLPEPASAALAVVGLLACVAAHRRRLHTFNIAT